MVGLTRTASELLSILFAVWVAIGVTLAVVMGRRGHSAFEWLIVGAVLGLLALPLAWISVRDERDSQARELVGGVRSAGPIDVLVGIDGSIESQSALTAAAELLGTRIGRLTLAGVIHFDTTSTQARDNEQRAIELLERAASSVDVHHAGTILLAGQPADALMKLASQEAYHIIAVGRRGSGASKAFLGSTASQLANGSDVPVLIV
jgi:nucleotide-binding universal stress UspA family protein